MENTNLVKFLFETNAVRVCDGKNPFWYTSGLIGPYYINTHFLYGSEDKANQLLKFIDEKKQNKETFSKEINDKVWENYLNDTTFKQVIDILVENISKNVNVDSIDYISGGERRDWFFSFPVAIILQKPHITIYKDGSMTVFQNDKNIDNINIKKARVLHIADLITVASSYERVWIPSINNIGKIYETYAIVDRNQGGRELLIKNNIKMSTLVSVDKDFFTKANIEGYINEEQKKIASDFIDNPFESMRSFLIENEDFLEKALASSNEKIVLRAKTLIENDLYNLK